MEPILQIQTYRVSKPAYGTALVERPTLRLLLHLAVYTSTVYIDATRAPQLKSARRSRADLGRRRLTLVRVAPLRRGVRLHGAHHRWSHTTGLRGPHGLAGLRFAIASDLKDRSIAAPYWRCTSCRFFWVPERGISRPRLWLVARTVRTSLNRSRCNRPPSAGRRTDGGVAIKERDAADETDRPK